MAFRLKKAYFTKENLIGEYSPWIGVYITPKIGVMPNISPHAKEPALVSFGAAMRAARVGKGLSQEELANDSGIDRSYLGAIERGEQNAGLLHLVRIAEALDMPLSDVLATARL